MLKKLSFYIDSTEPRIKNSSSKSFYSNDSFDFLALIKLWPEIAGNKLSEHTIPLKNQNGTLIILSNHSAFANELSFMEIPLKRKIFEKFPELSKKIKSIKFIVDSTHFEVQYNQFSTKLQAEKKKFELHPHSPQFKKLSKEAHDLFSHLEDEELKRDFISLYIQTNSQEKSS